MPDPIRGEMVNIGLLIYSKRVDIRLLKSASKLRMLDNTTSTADINNFESFFNELNHISPEPQSLIENISCISSSIIISKPAIFSIEHINQYEAKIMSLFDKLVKPHSIRERTQKNSRLITNLKRKFESIKVLEKDESELTEHKIVSNYVLNKSNGISADFLLKNGIYHLSEVIDYDVVDKKSKFKETTLKIMTFVEGGKSLDGELATYFVYSASPSTEKEVTQQINLAEDYSTKIFNLASKQDEAAYFQIIENAIGRELPLMH